MALQWTQALSVGVDEIDDQHRELFRRAARLLDGIKRGEPEEIGALVDFLHEYAVTHFGAEEAFMREEAFPGYVRHKAEHDRFISDLLALAEKTDGRDAASVEKLVGLLRKESREILATLRGLEDEVAELQGKGEKLKKGDLSVEELEKKLRKHVKNWKKRQEKLEGGGDAVIPPAAESRRQGAHA